MAHNKKRKSGQSTLSFMSCFPVLLFVVSLSTLSTVLTTANNLLKAETYYLARAHLYGNQLDYCSLASFWPSLFFKSTHATCFPGEEHNMEISFITLLKTNFILRSTLITKGTL